MCSWRTAIIHYIGSTIRVTICLTRNQNPSHGTSCRKTLVNALVTIYRGLTIPSCVYSIKKLHDPVHPCFLRQCKICIFVYLTAWWALAPPDEAVVPLDDFRICNIMVSSLSSIESNFVIFFSRSKMLVKLFGDGS